jgi:hypothetical protein
LATKPASKLTRASGDRMIATEFLIVSTVGYTSYQK